MTGQEKRLGIRNKAFYIAILYLIIFFGCATKEAVKKVPDKGELRERVIAYWTSKIEGNLIKCYEYELPQNRMTLENYIRRFSNPIMTYKSFELQSIERKDADVADVNLTIVPVVKVPGARAFEHTTAITERWVRVNDNWYHTSKRVSNDLTKKKKEGGDVKD